MKQFPLHSNPNVRENSRPDSLQIWWSEVTYGLAQQRHPSCHLTGVIKRQIGEISIFRVGTKHEHHQTYVTIKRFILITNKTFPNCTNVVLNLGRRKVIYINLNNKKGHEHKFMNGSSDRPCFVQSVLIDESSSYIRPTLLFRHVSFFNFPHI